MQFLRREWRNNLIHQLEKKLTKKGYISKVEQSIIIDGNLRIPDLTTWEKDHSIICDVTIISDTAPLDEVHTSKVQKYDDKDIHVWMTQSSPGEFPPPKVCNRRGAISSKSNPYWCSLSFSRSLLENLSTTALFGTCRTWKSKSDGKELACSNDIYCAMHGLILKC